MARAFTMGRIALLSLLLASSGCLAVPSVQPEANVAHKSSAPAAPAAPSEPPITLIYQPTPFTGEGIIARGTSSDADGDWFDQTTSPIRTSSGLAELPTCSLNPIISVLAGDTSSRSNDDALQSMAMLGATSAIHILRAIGGGSPSNHPQNHFHRSADFLDDMLQPDDDTARMRQVRPPCYFTLGCNW